MDFPCSRVFAPALGERWSTPLSAWNQDRWGVEDGPPARSSMRVARSDGPGARRPRDPLLGPRQQVQADSSHHLLRPGPMWGHLPSPEVWWPGPTSVANWCERHPRRGSPGLSPDATPGDIDGAVSGAARGVTVHPGRQSSQHAYHGGCIPRSGRVSRPLVRGRHRESDLVSETRPGHRDRRVGGLTS